MYIYVFSYLCSTSLFQKHLKYQKRVQNWFESKKIKSKLRVR